MVFLMKFPKFKLSAKMKCFRKSGICGIAIGQNYFGPLRNKLQPEVTDRVSFLELKNGLAEIDVRTVSKNSILKMAT